ncbi:30S ribosomal protein S4 [Candidatus Kuenenbacteria bacterium CG_4_9_14_3_um_filter_39_14]|uniref:Small ribosomal subunit protein uS4 n=7 Tax=Candidatus Kueneniibacteriota TaxID=1752740 RepID=A0A2M7IMK9_9BACT|nr:30S ribosomal protein S4 [Candidatus Kuenenbacteria bacterium]OIP56407.1 MAG: 30S ribosomal protein S4 [Candidatus Kuenenbacteria bacterium CG2_30_39_24]PIP28734.1 MAG: 30S ribosomal protein S4 [Candidatus Kuenenbacteria bacterium CG23_combo_of_CG06-09_8_20_14_all_39_39]PIP75194.1 MAG: 30S ribosomal protein S4 [Candidatus Kuenenbacteria bacterium CG22_combo_CG10-13_8_21_14_all_39_9]PIR80545.1 MAG: 30S ribosomal protein S4 [Candidatus Kuenenbacteria bacterium CG10_big_fil_rev_8_21_14_0_10_39_
MGRDIGPKDKQSRRIGEKLFLKGARDLSAKSAIVKRAYPPGIHGPKSIGRKLTEYGRQLMAKQKIKKMYRLRERQFSNYYQAATKIKGDVSSNLLKLLENRFDNTVYRLGFADSRDQARQLVGHAHFMINGKKVKTPSYQMKLQDKITIRQKSQNNGYFKEVLKQVSGKDVPSWLEFDPQSRIALVVDSPAVKDLNLGADITMTIEFYSR